MGSGYINCNILKKTYSAFKAIVDDSLTEVTAEMLSGITSITSFTFKQCANLISVVIPSGVTSIGKEAFSGCSSLASVTIPSSVTSIGDYTFSYCTSLTSIDIPSSVTSIGAYAFNSCSHLASVTVEATTPPTLGSSVFGYASSNLVIYVPSGSVDTYKAANNWSTYASRIQAIP